MPSFKPFATAANTLRARLSPSLRTRGGGIGGPSRWTSPGHEERPKGFVFNRPPPPPGESRKWEDWELPYYFFHFHLLPLPFSIYCQFLHQGLMAPHRRVSRHGGTSRSSRSQTSRYTLLEPEFYGLTITNKKARQNFAAYKGRGLESTRFVNREALEMPGLWDDVQRLLHSCGWRYLLTMHVPTYEAQVLEMTSTMDITCTYRNQ